MTAFDSQYDLVNEDDAALLRRFVRSRDEDAFAAIVQRYTGAVYATCKRVLGSRAMAEEASQEAFLRLLKQPENIRQSLGGWLHRTATTISIDMIRRDASRRSREQAFATAPRPVSRWDELSPIIDEALADLPDDDCDLLVQHFIRGRSQRELAEAAAVSPATMSRRIHAALDGLREQLRQRGVVVAIAGLTFMLATSAAHAAPAALAAELGKMSMVSGSQQIAAGLTGAATPTATAAGSATMALWLPIATGAMVVIAAAGVIVMAVVAQWPRPAPETTAGDDAVIHSPAVPPPPAADRATPEPGRADRLVNIYVLPASLDDVSATRISMFEDPAGAADDHVTVVYTDSHVQRISVAALAAQLKKQTGQSLAALTDTMMPTRMKLDDLAGAPTSPSHDAEN